MAPPVVTPPAVNAAGNEVGEVPSAGDAPSIDMTSALLYGAGAASAFVLLIWGLLAIRRALRPAPPPAEPVYQAAPPPQPQPEPQPEPDNSPRPWVEIDIVAKSARWTLLGASVVYRLTLSNPGEAEGRDILVGVRLDNADFKQQQRLDAFFAAPVEAAHRVERLGPGEQVTVEGLATLPRDAFQPTRVGERLLLVPMLAANLRYVWGEGSAHEQGQSAAAYVVGRENDPPTERLQPLRLDQGPREFAPVGARRTDAALFA